MNLLRRISKLIAANINHLIARAQDPERLLDKMIREMEESVIELRRETVRVVARCKKLEKEIASAEKLMEELEEGAKLALSEQDERLAREFVGRKLQEQKSCDALRNELITAFEVSGRLKLELARLQTQLLEARRGQEDLTLRRSDAEGRRRAQQTIRKSLETASSSGDSLRSGETFAGVLQSMEESIISIEAEAEVMQELALDAGREFNLEKSIESVNIDLELQRLKREISQ